MILNPSRRFLLAAGAASAAWPSLCGSARAAVVRPSRLTVERRTIEVNGRAASVFGIRQPDGLPGLVLNPGQPFTVEVANRSGEPTIVHWHGQTPPFLQDGVAETRRRLHRLRRASCITLAARTRPRPSRCR